MWGLSFLSVAQHHGSLEGSRSPVLSIRTGAVSRPLSDKQQRLFPVVQLWLEELKLLMWQFDTQYCASISGPQILLHPHLPASGLATLSWPGLVQHLGCRLLHGCDSHLSHLEHNLSRPQNFGRWVSLCVMARGSQGKRGLGAGRVWVVLVNALPGVLLRIKGEVSREEENGGTCFAVLADPATGQR